MSDVTYAGLLLSNLGLGVFLVGLFFAPKRLINWVEKKRQMAQQAKPRQKAPPESSPVIGNAWWLLLNSEAASPEEQQKSADQTDAEDIIESDADTPDDQRPFQMPHFKLR